MSIVRETWYIYLRNLRIWIMQPVNVLPSLFISAFLYLVFGSSFGDVIDLPGFPATNYNAFLTAMILVQAVVFSGGDAGFGMLTDILSGYFDKLLLAPINRSSILLAQLMIAGTRALVQVVAIVLLAYALGVRFESGMGGVLFVIWMATTFGVAWACLGLIIAFKTKSAQATQSTFVLFMPIVFLTTSFMPYDFLPRWFQIAVNLNPANYVLESMRALVVQGWEWGTVLTGLWVLLGLMAVLVGGTAWLYRRATT